MSTTSNRQNPAADPGAGPRPDAQPEPSGGIEGGTVLVGLIVGSGLVLMVLKLLGLLG